jgi:homogentisate phytyltransferase / homogentisate geranylgeranyltransferase
MGVTMQADHSVSHPSKPTVGEWILGLYRFSRPESTLGSAVMCTAIAVAVLPAIPYDTIIFAKVTACILSLSLWTIAGHGINQIYDLPVDRINKPDFPLPSGIMTIQQAWIVSIGTGVIGSLLAWWAMPLWLALGFVGFMTWASAAYSVPRFGSRTVRNSPLLPKLLTICFRAIVYPTTAFLTVWYLTPAQSLGLVYLAFILTFAVLFCVGMNTFEDIPDMKGDLEGGYSSFALALGVTRTAWICGAAFTCSFLGLSLWILTSPQSFRVLPGLAVEALLLLVFTTKFVRLLSSSLQPDGEGAKPFYIFLWRLYALQYLSLIVIFSPTHLITA